MQEDKEPLFGWEIPQQLYSTWVPQRGHVATDMADYLVRKGVPFRETYHMVGQACYGLKNRSDVASQGATLLARLTSQAMGVSLSQVKDQIQTLKD
ncbi:argininosuccinate lyase [Massospora cicadina]|nr:argininosuccinate lyase [Massospora cicadina]